MLHNESREETEFFSVSLVFIDKQLEEPPSKVLHTNNYPYQVFKFNWIQIVQTSTKEFYVKNRKHKEERKFKLPLLSPDYK